jgi:UDP-N-acetylmuramyl pentapeptide phosphotransferase/UDP-N-acetylglucosamine-1-phosphate transferase
MNILEYQKGLKLEKIKPFNLIYCEEDYLLSVFAEKLSEFAPVRVLWGSELDLQDFLSLLGESGLFTKSQRELILVKEGELLLKKLKDPKLIRSLANRMKTKAVFIVLKEKLDKSTLQREPYKTLLELGDFLEAKKKLFYLLLAFLSSFLVCYFLLKLSTQRALDHTEGVQKLGKDFAKEYLLVILSSLPVFLGGLAEDLTKKVGPKTRLLMAFISGILAFLLLGIHLTRTDVPVLDFVLSNSLIFSVLFTSFALAGVSNAVNIIDGFNGLASGVLIISFLAYAYVSYLLGDFFLLYLSLTITFALIGFFFWNFPFGYIFLGDGGAYLLGFLAGLFGVLVVERHPEVSPWFPFLLLLYPIYETIFSILRRKLMRGFSPFQPDAIHLHSLIYKRVVMKHIGSLLPTFLTNSLTSPYLWFITFIYVIPAVLFWNRTNFLVLFSILFMLFYTWLYFRIFKFKTPELLTLPLKVLKEWLQ